MLAGNVYLEVYSLPMVIYATETDKKKKNTQGEQIEGKAKRAQD